MEIEKKLLGFDGRTKRVTAKVGGKGGPIIIIPPDDGPDGEEPLVPSETPS